MLCKSLLKLFSPCHRLYCFVTRVTRHCAGWSSLVARRSRWGETQKKKKKVTPRCGVLMNRVSSFSDPRTRTVSQGVNDGSVLQLIPNRSLTSPFTVFVDVPTDNGTARSVAV